jgi:hypothetical protein
VKRLCIVVLFAAFITSLAPAARAAALSPRSQAAKAVLSQSTPVYKAAFGKKRLKGWVVASGPAWHVGQKGIATFDGSDAGTVLAPFSTHRMHDLSVQASIRVVGTSTQYVSGYGVVVRAVGGTGVDGGTFASSVDDRYNRPLLVWKGESVGGTNAILRPGYNTYRVDVHGSDFTLSIDGHQIIQFTITDYSDSSVYPAVGLWSLYRKIQVKSFTVSRLRTAAPLPAAPPVKALDLAPADVPAGLSPLGGAYYTGQELDDLRNHPAGTENAEGLLLGYQASFGTASPPTSGPFGLYSYVYAFRSSQDARSSLSRNWPRFQKEWSGPNFAASDVSGLGDEAHQYIVDYTETGYGPSVPSTMVGVFFRRGGYEINMFEDFVQGSMPRSAMAAQATALAKIVDGRIQGAGGG